MLHALSEKIAVFLFDNSDNFPIDVYVYGIELTLSSLVGMFVVLLIGLISGFLIESIIFMISLSIIRIYSGGYHARSYLKCNLVLIISYVFVLLYYKYHLRNFIEQTYLIASLTFAFLIITLIIFAPVKSESKNISKSENLKFKIISIVVSFIELLILVLFFGVFGFKRVIVILPTVMVVVISILAELILQKRRIFYEKFKTKIKEDG